MIRAWQPGSQTQIEGRAHLGACQTYPVGAAHFYPARVDEHRMTIVLMCFHFFSPAHLASIREGASNHLMPAYDRRDVKGQRRKKQGGRNCAQLRQRSP